MFNSAATFEKDELDSESNTEIHYKDAVMSGNEKDSGKSNQAV